MKRRADQSFKPKAKFGRAEADTFRRPQGPKPQQLRTGKSLAELAKSVAGGKSRSAEESEDDDEEVDDAHNDREESKHAHNKSKKSRKAPVVEEESNFMKLVKARNLVKTPESYLAGVEKDDEEIEYLQRKLGMKSSDDFSDSSRLVKELRQDGYDDFLDFMSEFAVQKLKRGATKVVKSGSDAALDDEIDAKRALLKKMKKKGSATSDSEEEAELESVDEEDEDEDEDEEDEEQGDIEDDEDVEEEDEEEQEGEEEDEEAGESEVEEDEDEDVEAEEDEDNDNSEEDSDGEEEDGDGDGDGDEDEEDEEDDEDSESESDVPNTKGKVEPTPKKRPDLYGRDLPTPSSLMAAATDSSTVSSQASLAGEASGPGKYVPPHLRKLMQQQQQGASGSSSSSSSTTSASSTPSGPSAEATQRLRRQVNGQLNKLTVENADAVLKELRKLGDATSKGDLLNALVHCVIETILTMPRTQRVTVLADAALVACLHRMDGAHVGSAFMEAVVRELQVVINRDESKAADNGDADQPPEMPSDAAIATAQNLVVLLCGLYAFKVVGCQLVMDALSTIALECKNWPLAAEMLVAGLDYAGIDIRKDDPAALKTLITSVQRRAKTEDAKARAVGRAAFMLEVLNSIRNNKQTSTGVARDSAVKDLAKWIDAACGLVGARMDRQMNTSWSDVISAGSRGRWWLVGASFRPSEGSQGGAGKNAGKSSSSTGVGDDADDGELSGVMVSEDALSRSAAQQGMNTSVRRAVFSIVMGSSDYLDAFEKVVKLGLTSQQERQAVRVIVHCCAQEKGFNPYYAALLNKLCLHERRYRFTTQLVLWDVIKQWRVDAENEKASKKSGSGSSATSTSLARQVNNVGKLTAICVEQQGISLNVLKTFDFDELESTDILYMHALFSLLLRRNSEEQEIKSVVACLVVKKELDVLRNGVSFFLIRYLIPIFKQKAEDEDSRVTLSAAKKMLKELK